MNTLPHASKMIEDTVARMATAKSNFIENAMKLGEMSKDEAEAVFNHYRKIKIIKYSLHGAYIVKHGAFWDKEVLQRAKDAK